MPSDEESSNATPKGAREKLLSKVARCFMCEEAPVGAREKLLEAAMRVFARDGLHKASTRAIAKEAGVSEVTLFRHFKNKDGLLAAVIGQAIKTHVGDALDEANWKGDLRANLLLFAGTLYSNMVRDEDFIRTMIGEAKRHPEYAERVIADVVKPMRDGFIANLEVARSAGKVRAGVDLGMASDVFTAMLLGGMLKNQPNGDGFGGQACGWGYSPEKFVAMCVDIFVNGLAPPPESRS